MRIAGLLLVASVLGAETIGGRIDKILAESPAAQQSYWGIHIVDLATGAIVYERNQDRFFIPASNTKLFSTALALTKLGPDHRFRTTITAPAKPDASGRVARLRFVGGGDPNLSGRILPYAYNVKPDNPLRYVEQFAQQLVDSGLKTVDGDVIGDDSAYANEPYPEGWALDDPVYDYGAPVTALFVNDAMFTVHVTPTSLGRPPTIELSPMVESLILTNRAVTAATTKLKYERLPGTRELTVSGPVATTQEEPLGEDDPTLFAAESLREALIRRGVRISGQARVEHFPSPDEVPLLTYDSLPILEDLRVINKESQNLHAEIALLEVARVCRGTGSREAGLEVLKAFLSEIGVEDEQYYFEDGSGLSRKTLVTPRTITRLLLYMYASPRRDAWIGTLPIGGVDGSLDKRFAGHPAGAQVHAKTGSITHVNALSGYTGRYAFSILVNNSLAEAKQIRHTIDRIALTLVQ
jgi:D-alanyl-D-alanine carboxypeptidase/D-alanyl-D-alanine-endopeptidase (penicillin-binding protein 4)